MKKFLLILFFIIYSSSFIIHPAYAQTAPLPEQPLPPTEHYVKAKVLQIIQEKTTENQGIQTFTQILKVQILEGTDANKIVTIQRGNDIRLASSQKITTGETVVVDEVTTPKQPTQYTIADTYRLTYLWYIAIAFFAFIVFATGTKGIGAILGLVVSISVILGFMVPLFIHGADPLVVSILGAVIILLTTTFVAHGFSKQTGLAVVSTFLALMATVVFSVLAVHIAHLAGLGTEDSYILELNPSQSINPRGLLLAGIIIGALGALNDITTTQVAAIFALKKSNPAQTFLHLVEHGFFIGREHIVSLVNTLVLAYAGASLPIFIFFVLNPSHLPAWVIINNESVSEEIIRTIAGSMGLVLAIPITTLLASWWVSHV